MTLFALIAAAFVLAALLFVLVPLLRRSRAAAQAADGKLSVYRDEFAELERDLRLGTLDEGQYEAARADLQRRVLEEVGNQEPAKIAKGSKNRLAAVVIGLSVPLLAGALYWHLGAPQGIGAAKHAAPKPDDLTVEQFQAMTEKLAARMASNPDDPLGWLMLGRAYKALQRYPEAIKALQEANARKPDDAQVLVEYAEALAQRDGKLDGEPRRLLERALKIAPDDARALTLAGGAAFEARDYSKAVMYWERLARKVPPESELGQALAAGLERARAAAAGKPMIEPAPQTAADGGQVSGRVTLSDVLKDKVKPDDTVFIFARAAQGPRMPLAIVRRQVKDLPVDFRLDDSMAMNPQMKLSGVDQVVITARVSRAGSAMPASGDLQGESAPVKPDGATVRITIDRVLP